MMPKMWASHTGLFLLAMILTLGVFSSGRVLAQDEGDMADVEGEVIEEQAASTALLRLRNFRATPTFATDVADGAEDVPLISLTWTNPPDAVVESGIYQLTLYRSTRDFPTGTLDGNRIPLAPGAESYLDRDVLAGETYYYTLVGDVPGGIPENILDRYPLFVLGEFPQMRYAKVVAGTKAAPILTESFGQDILLGQMEPFDLAFSQITIYPVGAPQAPLGERAKGATYTGYEATIQKEVYSLPVPRSDDKGGAITISPLRSSNLLELPLGDMRFPFFGVDYDKLYLSANGYIVFEDFFAGLGTDIISIIDLLDIDEEDFDVIEALNSPNIAGHFTIPRISFLFSFLEFQTGGGAWARMLDDRVVITFENVPESYYNPLFSPTLNTVQVELFFSGKIRLTYLNAFVYAGIVGLSDGRGIPVDPTDEFDDVEPAYGLTNFLFLPSALSQLTINPVAPPVVRFDENAAFMVDALAPAEAALPVFNAEWSKTEMAAPFADVGGGKGNFFWKTAYKDIGAHTVRVYAQLNDMEAHQDVRIIVNSDVVKPSAINLTLSTNTNNEDPAISRAVGPDQPLIASYTYFHPFRKQSPLLYEEFLYILYWFRNDQVVSAFTNAMVIPPDVPQPGEKWRFQVTPITVSMIFGAPANSPVVSILAPPEIASVAPIQGLTVGGEAVTIKGRYLGAPISVKFGDASVTDIIVVSDSELSVVTPLHAAGAVPVTVRTAGGVGVLKDAFSFVGNQSDEPADEDEDDAAEKKRQILGCGSGGHDGTASGGMMTALLAMLVLAVGARRQQRSTD